ncbi:darcynin family protein [Aquabacterium humicola]|uniref:darcynin family protein n=1 Tax=Aquabacterium humicola TaxID=3237377 RepID=UPI002543CD1C|nr:darcynin family protein [Rubrivivax pictus]
MNHVNFIHLRATPRWLRLSRQERRERAGRHLGEALRRVPGVKIRYFDAEAFTAHCSDVLMVEASEPREHHFFIESLRDSELVADEYFELVLVVPTIEEGYQAYEEATGQAGTRAGQQDLAAQAQAAGR